MKQKKFDWTIWFNDEKELERSFKFYSKKGWIKEEKETKSLSRSHLKKTDYNLSFINFLEENNVFFDWGIVGCYYAIYHASLALLVKKGVSSKNHLATLCCLIKFYYSQKDKNKLTKEEIELVSKSSLEKEEVTYFTEAKDKRETASYGVNSSFSKIESQDLKQKTIQFVNKCKEILDNKS
ncbi:MAG: hypothetical protein V1663_00420 [archaeon]